MQSEVKLFEEWNSQVKVQHFYCCQLWPLEAGRHADKTISTVVSPMFISTVVGPMLISMMAGA